LPAVSKPSSSKKRAAAVEESDEEDDLLGDVDELDLSEGDDEAEDDDADEEEDEDEEDFPELDSGSEDEGVEATTRQLAGDESSEEELLDDEESGSESGYNSSDIDALDSASSVSSSTSIPTQHSGSSKKSLSVDEKLSRLIAKNSVKPDERIGSDLQISNAKSGKGALRPSKLVEGGYKREYEDVEAGYGSESSTEDVSRILHVLYRADLSRTPILLETSPWSGMTTSRISDTTYQVERSSDQLRAMSSTNSSATSRIRPPGLVPRTSCSSSRSSSPTRSWISSDDWSERRILTRITTRIRTRSSGSLVKAGR
jgi:ribosome biogenesis protein ERB1